MIRRFLNWLSSSKEDDRLLRVLSSFRISTATGHQIAAGYLSLYRREIGYGTMYCRLRRLKEAGLVECGDEVNEDGERFRYFWLTAKGRNAMDGKKEAAV